MTSRYDSLARLNLAAAEEAIRSGDMKNATVFAGNLIAVLARGAALPVDGEARIAAVRFAVGFGG
jgi:hypothetical protein